MVRTQSVKATDVETGVSKGRGLEKRYCVVLEYLKQRSIIMKSGKFS